MAHVPPPRPKRKAAYPYQQKASDTIPACITWDDTSTHTDLSSNKAPPLPDYYPALPEFGDSGFAGIVSQNTYWIGNSSRSLQASEVPKQGNSHSSYPLVTPNFAEVYNFIGSMFDPYITWPLGVYLQKLREMDPITAKTVLVLVKNLIINMSSADFEPLGRWLSTYNANTKTIGGVINCSIDPVPSIYKVPSQEICSKYHIMSS